MPEISEAFDKILNKMNFIDYLNYMHDRIETISHRPKTDAAYSACRELTLLIKYRIVKEHNLSWDDFDKKEGKDLNKSEHILDKYGFSDSDKQKTSRIKEFVDEYTYDLSRFVRAINGR